MFIRKSHILARIPFSLCILTKHCGQMRLAIKQVDEHLRFAIFSIHEKRFTGQLIPSQQCQIVPRNCYLRKIVSFLQLPKDKVVR